MVDSKITFLTLVIFATCSPPADNNSESQAQAEISVPLTEVNIVYPQNTPFEYHIQTSGKVQSISEAKVQSKTSGLIKKIFTRNGHIVGKDFVLAELDNGKELLAMNKAYLTTNEKKIAYEDQILSFTRNIKDSVRFNIIKKNIQLISGLANAEVTYKEAKLEFENTFIKTPFRGMVSNLGISVGNTVTTGQVICYLHDPKNFIVLCEVLEADALKLTTGVLAEVTTLSKDAETLNGYVKEINPRVDEVSNLVRVILSIKETKELLPGMTVKITMKVPHQRNLIVPKKAIVVRSGRPVIFTVEDGLAKWNYVTIGNENGNEIEIIEGLNATQGVIITNNLQLGHDTCNREITMHNIRQIRMHSFREP